jgi:hypothetical protein
MVVRIHPQPQIFTNMKQLSYLIGLLIIIGLTSCSPYYYNSTNRSAVFTNDGQFSHMRYSGVGNSHKNGIRTKHARVSRKKCHRNW